jgi:hypothetical protein
MEMLPLQSAAVRRPENTEDQPSAVPAWQFDLKVCLVCSAMSSLRACCRVALDCWLHQISYEQSMLAYVQAFDTHEFPMPTSMLQRLCSYA